MMVYLPTLVQTFQRTWAGAVVERGVDNPMEARPKTLEWAAEALAPEWPFLFVLIN